MLEKVNFEKVVRSAATRIAATMLQALESIVRSPGTQAALSLNVKL